MAVEVENPFGHGASDLRLHEYNLQCREALREAWNRWCVGFEYKLEDEDRVSRYEQFGGVTPATKVSDASWSYW